MRFMRALVLITTIIGTTPFCRGGPDGGNIDNREYIWLSVSADAGSAAAEPDSNRTEVTEDSLARHIPRKPLMPSLEQAKAITGIHRAARYPSITFNLGVNFRKQNNDLLNQTQRRIENAFGVTEKEDFGSNSWSLACGLRIHFSRRSSLWWETVIGGSFSAGEDNVKISGLCLCPLYSIMPFRTLAVSFGSGLAFQRLQSRLYYDEPLDDGGTLDYAGIDTGFKLALPLIILLEINDPFSGPDNPPSGRGAFYVSIKHMVAPDASWTETNQAPSSVQLKTKMSGTWLTVGFNITI